MTRGPCGGPYMKREVRSRLRIDAPRAVVAQAREDAVDPPRCGLPTVGRRSRRQVEDH